MFRTTHQPSTVPATRMRIHWGRIAGASAVAVAGAGLIVAAWAQIPTADATPTDTSGGIGMCADAYSASCAGQDHESGRVIERAASEVRTITLTPCEYEDSRNCYWDADVAGNGEGVSFIDVDGVAYYPESE